jgi:hypothetical protein
MNNYAIIENNQVVNVIVADSLEVAQQTTNKEVIETTGQPWIGWTRVDGQWINPVPEIIDVEEVTPTPALEG